MLGITQKEQTGKLLCRVTSQYTHISSQHMSTPPCKEPARTIVGTRHRERTTSRLIPGGCCWRVLLVRGTRSALLRRPPTARSSRGFASAGPGSHVRVAPSPVPWTGRTLCWPVALPHSQLELELPFSHNAFRDITLCPPPPSSLFLVWFCYIH